MTLWSISALFIAAALAGALNSVAGGGSFIGLPALVFFGGLETKIANATNSVALWPGSVSSTIAYRQRVRFTDPVTLIFSLISLIGGALGAVVLLRTPQGTFNTLLPYLMLLATLLLAFGNQLTQRLKGQRAAPRSLPVILSFGLFQLLIAVYGGYFGGGQGIMMLALFSVMGMDDIHAMNGLKALLATLINGASVIVFTLAQAVVWPNALVMIAGAIIGGYLGAHFAQRIPPHYIRRFTIAVAVSMTIYFFWRAYSG